MGSMYFLCWLFGLGRQHVTLSEDAQADLDDICVRFKASRSSVIEALIDGYLVQLYNDVIEAWEARDEEDEGEEDEDEDGE